MKKLIILLIGLLMLCGCNTVISENTKSNSEASEDAYNLSFSETDQDASYSLNGSTYISLGDEDVKITKGGTYILEGNLSGSIIVEVSDKEDVQLVLNNVTIQSDDFAGIYIVEGDEITITLADGTNNTISDSSVYTQIDDNEVDALIYSKADLTINGNGTLNLGSDYNHGIVSKDDLIIISGTYNIDVAGQGMRGKDCLKIMDGTFKISSGKDSLKSDNEEDAYRGYIYIAGGSFDISSDADAIYAYSLLEITGGNFNIVTNESTTADSYKGIKSDGEINISGGTFNIDTVDDAIHTDGDITIDNGDITIESDDDGIHADSKITINDGNIVINAHEGIEATYVVINGGNISITANDDGINASQTVDTYTATIEFNGGYTKIVMGQGDTDAVDSNGYIIINDGTVDVSGQNTFDAELGSEFNGGTLIVNGTETDEIPADMMGGGGMHGMGKMNFNSGSFNQYSGDETQSPESAGNSTEQRPNGFNHRH